MNAFLKTSAGAGSKALLEVRDLRVHFIVRHGFMSRAESWVRAVDGVSFGIGPGETLGLVGESGCGKTTLGRAIVRLVDPTGGQILFEGEEITRLNRRECLAHRRRLQMIFQDSSGTLNPNMSAGDIIGEALDIHHAAATRQDRTKVVRDQLLAVGLEEGHARRYPHEFSGGQRQRIGIARALAVNPMLIVCDEPVSSLDVCVQAQVINLLEDLQRERHLAYLFISHDLALVEHLSHRVMVMYLGKVVEAGEARSVVQCPKHPYTQALVSAVPVVGPDLKRKRIVLPGEVPSSIHPPTGCSFHPRCPYAEQRCRCEVPVLRELEPGRWAACHLAK